MSETIEYKCHVCDLEGVRLWREAYEAPVRKLLCHDCSCREQAKPLDHLHQPNDHNKDQIGFRVPAVPVYHGEGSPNAFYGYTSVPQERVAWWYSLPTHPEVANSE